MLARCSVVGHYAEDRERAVTALFKLAYRFDPSGWTD
jgi:hypothetical protein